MNAKDASLGAMLRDARPALLGVAAFSCVVNVLMLASPLYMMQLYDRVLPSQSVPTLIALSLLLVGVVAVVGVFEFLRSRVMVRLGLGLDQRVASRVFEEIVEREPRSGAQHRDLPLQDLAQLRGFLTGPGLFTFFDAPWVPIYLLVITLLHPLLGAIALAGAVWLFGLALASERWTRKPLEAAAEAQDRESAWVESVRRGADTLIAMGMTSGAKTRWHREREETLQGQAFASDRAGLLAAVSRSSRLLLQSAMLGTGAALAIQGSVSAGAMVAGSILLGRALSPVEQAIAHWKSFLAARRAHRRLAALVGEAAEENGALRLPAPSGHLAVEGVTAGPPGARRATLKQVRFALEKGEVLGIIGKSGAGKSTLAKILAGIWTPQQGEVRLDETSLAHWHPDDVSRAVGYLPQQIELFEGTVRDNIARLDPDARDEEILRAAKLAGAHELIAHLPDGYETEIGRDGMSLSGGQRQRIALARALYGSPSVVILDEPNSSLDAEGDRALTRAIEALKEQGSTVVVIAHRPSAVAAVDRVLVLESGKVAAFGPRDEIMSPRGAKASTVRTRSNVRQLERAQA
ncbi:MAG: type I secretion system permease/ATPase [Myxococcota bacterium]